MRVRGPIREHSCSASNEKSRASSILMGIGRPPTKLTIDS